MVLFVMLTKPDTKEHMHGMKSRVEVKDNQNES